MKKYILLFNITIGLLSSTEYRITHLKKGTRLNVREEPIISAKTAIGSLPYNAIGIKIRECKYNKYGQEWCYISYPIGGEHIEGWISSRYLKPMKNSTTSLIYIKNFLKNFYLADEKNFLDKLQVFYKFPMQQYFYKKNVSLMQLRTLKVLFYKRWPIRKYRLTYVKILRKRRNYTDVQATIRWKLKKNNIDYETGRDIQKIRLVKDRNNNLKVLAIKTLKHTVYPKAIEINTQENNETNTTTNNTTDKPLFYVKIGSFIYTPNKDYLENITKSGFNYIIKNAEQNGETIKRLYIGPYDTEEKAIEELYIIRNQINPNAYIQSF